MEKIRWVDKKTNEEILNMVQEGRAHCCVIYLREGCWGTGQEEEERYS